MQALDTVQEIPVDRIVAGLNDRTRFDRAELESLAAHIAAHGLIQPPTLRARPDGTYQIVAGERRVRALRDVLGRATIPAFVRTYADGEALAVMGSENRSRVQLNPIDEAAGYARGMAAVGWTEAECAEAMGVTLRRVRDYLPLLELRDDLQALTASGQLSIGYAQALAKSGLNHTFQGKALEALNANPAPALAWWRGVIGRLVEAQGQAAMFDPDAFMVGIVEELQAATEADPPAPDTTEYNGDGATPAAILADRMAFWADAAAAWEARPGRKAAQQAAACRALVAQFRSLRAMLATLPAPEPAPVVAPLPAPAPVALPDGWTVGPAPRRATCEHRACYAPASVHVGYRAVTPGGARQLVLQTLCADHLAALQQEQSVMAL